MKYSICYISLFLFPYFYIAAFPSFTQNTINNVNDDGRDCNRSCFFPENEKFLYKNNKVTCGCEQNTDNTCKDEGGWFS